MCGLVVTTDGDRVVRVRGDEDHPLSRGYSCPKGRAIGELHHAPHRLDRPATGRGGARRDTDWDETLDGLGRALRDVLDATGPEGVAMYLASGSAFDTAGRRAAEKFLRTIGSPQKYTATTIDTPCKPLVAEAVGGWSGLTPVWDEHESSLLVLIGSNPIVSHGHSNAIPDPVRRLRAFRARGGVVVTVDPRRTETAAMSDLHLAPRPGTDWLLLAWTVRTLLELRPAPRRATGVDELRAALAPLELDVVVRRTGLDPDTIDAFVALMCDHPRVSALTGTGSSMNTHADVTEYLLWALHVVTDSYDTPGGMWFNPGLLSVLEERQLPVSDGRPGPGPSSAPHLPRRFDEWPCVALLDEIEAGTVRALIVVGGNPALAFPESERTRRALASLDVLAVIDILPTATTDLATHVLPAVDQLERSDLTWLLDTYQLAVAGQYTPAVVAPRADRRPVWWIMGAIGERLGLDLLGAPVDTIDERTLLEPLLRRSRVGIDALLDAPSGVLATGPIHGWVTERVLPPGGWRLAPPPLLGALRVAIAEAATAPSPATLLIATRRLRMMNSQFADLASGTDDEVSIRLHPSVAADHGGPGARVRVASEHGSVEGPIVTDHRLRPDCVVIGHGSSACDVSRLTSSTLAIDPLTGMPEQSAIPCRLLPALD